MILSSLMGDLLMLFFNDVKKKKNATKVIIEFGQGSTRTVVQESSRTVTKSHVKPTESETHM